MMAFKITVRRVLMCNKKVWGSLSLTCLPMNDEKLGYGSWIIIQIWELNLSLCLMWMSLQLEACAHPFFDELREPHARLPNGRPLPPLFNFKEEVSCSPSFCVITVLGFWCRIVFSLFLYNCWNLLSLNTLLVQYSVKDFSVYLRQRIHLIWLFIQSLWLFYSLTCS